MITFIVSNDHGETAQCLDQSRLNHQLTECVQIAKILKCYDLVKQEFNKIPFGLIFPPIIKLWTYNDRGCTKTLIPELYEYTKALNKEWKKYREVDHQSANSFDWIPYLTRAPLSITWPNAVINSHRAKLLHKDPTHYSFTFERLGLPVIDDNGDNYVWRSPTESLI